MLVAKNVRAKRLSFTTDLSEAMQGADAVFIGVGTPSRRGDGHADLSYVYAAAEEIAKAADDRTVIVTKSTVPVGTGDEVERICGETAPGKALAVVSNPEFLREGAAIEDFKRPDRIVVGSEEEWAQDVMREIYRPLYLNESPILFTSRRSSELIKYAANAFLATKITFINEMADLCEKVGGNVQDVARGIGLDKRIGPKFLNAGPGYGGSCFPKDTLALLKTAQDNESPVRIVEAVVNANDLRKRAMARKVIAALGGEARGKKVALFGLTFAKVPGLRELTHVVVLFLGFLLAQIAGWVQVARLDHRLGAERDGQDDFCSQARQSVCATGGLGPARRSGHLPRRSSGAAGAMGGAP